MGSDLSVDPFKIEADRIPVHLEKGRHRLLIRLELQQGGQMFFRARVGSEPQLAMIAYVQALAARQFPYTLNERMPEFFVMRDAILRRTTYETQIGFASIVCQMYDDQKGQAMDQMAVAALALHESNRSALAINALRLAVRRLEDGPEYQGRLSKIAELTRSLARALAAQGHFAEADLVLRDASTRDCVSRMDAASCTALRGTLRWELGMSRAAQPFFERCAREGRLSDDARQVVGPGLDWSRFYRPERVSVESSHEIQAQLDAVRRQLSGAPDDVEKAMRGLSDILRGSSNSLVKLSETPFEARFVGVREYVRTMLETLTPAQRDVYRKVAGEAAAQRLLRLGGNDPVGLEKTALEFPYTKEAQIALNRAGDAYCDRGRFAQAASIYLTLLRDSAQLENAATVCAKLAQAQAFNGQSTEAAATLKRLSGEFAGAQVKLKGTDQTGSAVAEQLKKQFEDTGHNHRAC